MLEPTGKHRRQPGLVTVVRRTLLGACGVTAGQGLLLGVSGGPDSMALLGVLAHLAPTLGLRVMACGVDHGLRPEASGELDVAEQWATEHSIPFERRDVRVPGSSNLQALAREARYGALVSCAGEFGLDYIVTAHHLEDRAETVLLRLLRGAGPEGLRVLPPRLGNRLRPMIHASKAQVAAYLTRHRIPFVNDPSNANDRFLRVRVRRELLPLLRELSPGIVEHLNNLADELACDPLPSVLDEAGEEILLNRAQRAQLRRALAAGRDHEQIWLSDGRVLVIDPETMLPRVICSNR